jgi:hypothetical protein
MTRTAPGALLVGAILVLAACGGGSPTQAPGGATQQPGATQGSGATSGTAPSEAPPVTTAPAATQSGGGGGIAKTACELLTPEEAARELGTGPLTAEGGELAGQTYCDYRESGATVLTTYMQPNAEQLWGVYETSLQADPVAGIGDKALYEPSTKLLLVLKGSTFFNIFIAEFTLSSEEALEKSKVLAGIMATRA